MTVCGPGFVGEVKRLLDGAQVRLDRMERGPQNGKRTDFTVKRG